MLRIDELYAFVIKDEDGDESLPAFRSDDIWHPLIAADKARVESLREMAQILSTQSGKPITLCRFSLRQELEVIQPTRREGEG